MMRYSYRQELIRLINGWDDDAFPDIFPKSKLLDSKDNIETVLPLFRKYTEDYGCEPEWAAKEAIREALGVEIMSELGISCYRRAEERDYRQKNLIHLYPDEEPERPGSDDIDEISGGWQEYMCLVEKEGKKRWVACQFSPHGHWLHNCSNLTEFVRMWQDVPKCD